MWCLLVFRIESLGLGLKSLLQEEVCLPLGESRERRHEGQDLQQLRLFYSKWGYHTKRENGIIFTYLRSSVPQFCLIVELCHTTK